MKKLIVALMLAPLSAMAAGRAAEVKVTREIERRVEDMIKATEGTRANEVALVRNTNLANKSIEMIQDGTLLNANKLAEAAGKTLSTGGKNVVVGEALKDLVGLRLAMNEARGTDAEVTALRNKAIDQGTKFIEKLSKDALVSNEMIVLATEATANMIGNLKSVIAKGNKEELQSYLTLLEKANSFDRASGIESLYKAMVEIYGEAEAIVRMKKVKDCIG